MVRQEGLSHIGYMKIEASNNIAAIRKAKGLTQQQLADLVGSHWITISKLERGIMRLTDDWIRRLATALDVGEVSLVAWSPKSLYRTHIAGRIHSDGRIEELPPDSGEVVVLHSDFFLRPWYSWYEAIDDALWPWFQDGDLVCIMDLEGQEDPESLVGKLALVWGDQPQPTIGRIEKSASAGRYDVWGGGRAPVRGIKPRKISPIVMAVMNVPIDAPQSKEDERLYGKVATKI